MRCQFEVEVQKAVRKIMKAVGRCMDKGINLMAITVALLNIYCAMKDVVIKLAEEYDDAEKVREKIEKIEKETLSGKMRIVGVMVE